MYTGRDTCALLKSLNFTCFGYSFPEDDFFYSVRTCLNISSPHVRESRRVLDSGFHTVDSGFQVLDSGFQLSGFRILKRAGFQIFLCVF